MKPVTGVTRDDRIEKLVRIVSAARPSIPSIRQGFQGEQ